MRLIVSATNPEPGSIAAAVDVLRAGGVVAYPTDTLYGLAADPRSDDAVERLFALKGRSVLVAVPLIAASLAQAERVATFGPRARQLAAAFWPGPLTLVLPLQMPLARATVAGGRTVAVRVPNHPLARALAEAFGFCITATSANLSGAPPAGSPDEIDAALRLRVDCLLDAGAAPGGPPSTIVEVRADGPTLVRAGAVAWERVLKSLQ